MWGSLLLSIFSVMTLLWAWFSLAPILLSQHIAGYLFITVAAVFSVSIASIYSTVFFFNHFKRNLNAKD